MNHYEQRQEERRERYLARAEKADTESAQRFDQAHRLAGCMNGQPILVGHHSEKRHRGDIRRMDNDMRKGSEAYKKAEHYRDKAVGVGKAGISSDDPDARAKLARKLAFEEQSRDYMKRLNAYWRKHKSMKGCEGVSEEAAARYDREIPERYSWERQPFPKWQVSNLGANIRRIKQRIEELEREGNTPDAEPVLGEGFRIEENSLENRVCFYFDEKPPREVCQLMRQHGFKWNRRLVAWTRHLNNAGRHAAEWVARDVVGKL